MRCWSFLLLFVFLSGVVISTSPAVVAAQVPQIVLPKINIGGEAAKKPSSLVMPLQILMLLSILSLAPYLLVMMTSFIRVAIVLSFIRTALGTQQVPPTQVLMGLALFITLYVMMPVGTKINNDALQPYLKEKISQREFFQKAFDPLKVFMIKQTREKDLALFFDLAKIKRPKTRTDAPMHVLLPAFMVSEIKTAFEIGFLLYIPFLVIDMVVASVLMSMGMFMLSPMSISLPFKLLLFVMIDGWELIVKGLVSSFH